MVAEKQLIWNLHKTERNATMLTAYITTQPPERQEPVNDAVPESRQSYFRKMQLEHLAKIRSLRGTGRTSRACERAVELCRTLPDGSILMWRIPVYHWTAHIVSMLDEMLRERLPGVDVVQMGSTKVRVVTGGRMLWLIFLVAETADRLRGIQDVHWVYDEGECYDFELFGWLTRMVEMEPTK